MFITSFQLAVVPIALEFVRILSTANVIVSSRITTNLWFNLILQLAGFGMASLYLWFQRRWSQQEFIAVSFQFDVGMVMRQLGVLQLIRIVGLFVIYLVFLALGWTIDELSGNPYVSFAEVTNEGYLSIFLLIVVVVIFGPLFEELVFRVLFVTELQRLRINEGVILLLSGLVFGLAHLQTNLLLALQTGSYSFLVIHLLNSTVTGAVFAYVYLRTRSLSTIWFMHALINFMGVTTILGFTEHVIIFNVFLLLLGLYLSIRHYFLFPFIFNELKRMIASLYRKIINAAVLSSSLFIQLVFEVLIPVNIVQQASKSSLNVMMSGYGIVTFVLFLLIVIVVLKGRTLRSEP